MDNSHFIAHSANQLFADKLAYSSSTQGIGKFSASKIQLRDLIKNNTTASKKEVFNSNTNSVIHQQLSIENSIADNLSNKTYESGPIPSQSKTFESTKSSKKPIHANFATFFKDRSSKPNILEINTSFQVQQGDHVHADSKPSSTKNRLHSRYNYSPYRKRTTLLKENKGNITEIARNLPHTMKNSHSINFDAFGSPKSAAHMGTPKFLQAYNPQNQDLTLKTLHTQEDLTAKLISPPKIKQKDERASISEGVSHEAKLNGKRGNSYRKNRRQSQLSETQDDPTMSKVSSVKGPLRGNYSGQKSQSLFKHETLETGEDSKNYSISQKSVNLYDGKKRENKNLNNSRAKQQSDLTSPMNKKARSQAAMIQNPPNLHLIDVEKYESLLKTSSSTAKKDSMTPTRGLKQQRALKIASGQTSISKSKEEFILHHQAPENGINKFLESSSENHQVPQQKQKFADHFSSVQHLGPQENFSTEDFESHMVSVFSVGENYEHSFDKHFASVQEPSLKKESRISRTLSPNHQPRKASLTQKEKIGKALLNMMKKNTIEEMRSGRKSKFSDTKSKSFKNPKEIQNNTNSLQEKVQREILMNSQKDEILIKADVPSLAKTEDQMAPNLQGVLIKTKKLLDEYQKREKNWMQEREVLLARIEQLEKNAAKSS